MKRAFLTALAVPFLTGSISASSAQTSDAPPTIAAVGPAVDSRPPVKLSSTKQTFDRTITGQALVLPKGPITVTVQLATFPAGFSGPWHKQPYPRYAYILSGRLRVIYEDSGLVREFGPGAAMAEGIDQWHRVDVVGAGDVKILVVDQAPPGVSNVIVRPDPASGS
jgi:quercetin dioxygenase-like cupin family protein